MRILHIGSASSIEGVNGVNHAIWIIAQEQANLGHQVMLLLDQMPDTSSQEFARKAGIELIYASSNRWSYCTNSIDQILQYSAPQIVHMHSVFLPKQFTLSQKLIRRKIPYIITPHGMSPAMLQRDCLKKSLYSYFIEKPRFYRAAAISVVTPKEGETVRSYVPNYSGEIRWIPNPIHISNFTQSARQPSSSHKQLVYLGRFDVLHKGIDILVEIARHLPPDIEVHLYGISDAKTSKWMKQISQQLPDNVHLHDPVFNSEKLQVLTSANLYIQTSRWEVFGISIAEAMSLGVPCAITNTINLAEQFQQNDLGLVLSSDPQIAATQLIEAINCPHRLQHWSKQGKAYAQQYFHPQKVASAYLKLYEEVLAQ